MVVKKNISFHEKNIFLHENNSQLTYACINKGAKNTLSLRLSDG